MIYGRKWQTVMLLNTAQQQDDPCTHGDATGGMDDGDAR
jgi:hypothetical protein